MAKLVKKHLKTILHCYEHRCAFGLQNQRILAWLEVDSFAFPNQIC